MTQRPSQKTPRKRLGIWRFLLALLLGLIAWWVVGQLTEPRPLWTILVNSNQVVILPLSEAADSNMLVAYELKFNPVRSDESTLSGISILDSTNGKTLYRLPYPDELWQPEQFINQSYRQALPRIIGDVLWRMNVVETEKIHRYELRAWHYTQKQEEQIVQTWNVMPGTSFDFAFASSASPYLVTQTGYRFHSWLAGLGIEGWSNLAAQLAHARLNDMKDTMGMPSRIIDASLFPGPILPVIQTWKLPVQPKDALQPLASWTLPPQRTVWPPACGPDMNWIAFGNVANRTSMNSDRVSPRGLLLFDGHSGKPRPHNLSSALFVHFSAVGDLLLATSQHTTNEQFQHHLINGRTGKEVALPVDLANTRAPVILSSDLLLPGRYLATIGAAYHPYLNYGFPTENSPPEMVKLHLSESGLQAISPKIALMPKDPLKESQQYGMTYFAGNELGVFGAIDTAPPLLRELAERWNWLKSWVEKSWPRSTMTLMLFDSNTGKHLRHIRDVMNMPLFSTCPKKLLYTLRYRRGPPNGQEAIDALDAWQLPIETLGTSAWWGRIAGILVFVAAILLLRQRVTTTLTPATK